MTTHISDATPGDSGRDPVFDKINNLRRRHVPDTAGAGAEKREEHHLQGHQGRGEALQVHCPGLPAPK